MTSLVLQHIRKAFDGITAVDDISLNVRAGAINALIGPNGAGKTTLFDMVSGLTTPDKGHIYFEDHEITRLSSHKIARLGISRTFQNIRLFQNLTVLENLMLATQSRTAETLMSALIRRGVTSEERKSQEKAVETLRFIDLQSKKNDLAGSLSQGQRRLLEIGRAIALDSSFLLLDEPTAGVFPQMIDNLKDLLRRLRAEHKTIFIIEHNMNFIMDISDYIFVLNHGKKIAEGTPNEIRSNDQVITAYLGRRRR